MLRYEGLKRFSIYLFTLSRVEFDPYPFSHPLVSIDGFTQAQSRAYEKFATPT